MAHCETRAKSSRPGRMVVVLLVRENIHKHLSAVGVPALVPDYAPRSWRIKCKCVHCGIKYINASQNNSYKKTCFADIKHTCNPHQNRILTDCWRHQRCFRNPSIHSNIVNRRQVLFLNMFKNNKTEKKIDKPVRVQTPLLKSRDKWPRGVKSNRQLNQELKAMDSSDYGMHHMEFNLIFFLSTR